MNSKDKKTNKKKIIDKKILIKIVIFLFLFIILCFLIKTNYTSTERKKEFENSISDIAKLNEEKVFSIDKIYLFSSAYATVNETQKPIWDINPYQYTDIAVYLNNHNNSGNTDKNTIKECTIDNIKFNNLELGTPQLYYKNIIEFGKFNLKEENLIQDSLSYNIIEATPKSTNMNELNETTISQIQYEKPELYTTCDNPITLEYINSNIKNNSIISDITTPLVYDGSLLKKCGITLNSISCDLSFTIHIMNHLDEKYKATVSISIPLTESTGSGNIYSGNMRKELTNQSITFFREK